MNSGNDDDDDMNSGGRLQLTRSHPFEFMSPARAGCAMARVQE